MKTVFKFLLSLLIIYSLISAACYGYTYIDRDSGNNGEFDFFKPARFIADIMGGIPDKTNFVIFGTDGDGTRTDTIMAGCYHKSEKKISLVSIPRDTIVTVDEDTFYKMNEGYPEPGDYSMKLNSVYHFSKEEYGSELAVAEVEKIIGSDIDYYAIVDFDALKEIVDTVGGIEFVVPCNMYYADPEQDLYIDLQAGYQTLDGDKAEQLLRFRSGYDNADLGRVEVQQEFVKEFINQVASAESISKNIKDYIKICYNYVDTDIPLGKLVRYGVSAIKAESVETVTAPGYADFYEGISGFVIDDKDGILTEIFR